MKKGYKARGYMRGPGGSRSRALARFKKRGSFRNRKDGSGHLAGENWGAKKGIDPNSRTWRYSKNSPSFDEGVYTYKAKNKALENSKK